LINEWSNPKFAGFQLDLSQYSLVEHIKKLLANNGEISILDIGGGFGDNFYYIDLALGKLSKRIDYQVVDNKVQCEFGIEFYKNKGKTITFKTEIPKLDFDLIIIIGTIQYIEHWKEFVSEMTKKSTNSIYISRTPISTTYPTFITVQSICPARGPSALKKLGESNVNIINNTELDQAFEKNGFSIDKSLFIIDYSHNFKRLPPEFQNIQYIDKYFKKSN
jgi:putative methyltransferase (TIGR04325 family)